MKKVTKPTLLKTFRFQLTLLENYVEIILLLLLCEWKQKFCCDMWHATCPTNLSYVKYICATSFYVYECRKFGSKRFFCPSGACILKALASLAWKIWRSMKIIKSFNGKAFVEKCDNFYFVTSSIDGPVGCFHCNHFIFTIPK